MTRCPTLLAVALTAACAPPQGSSPQCAQAPSAAEVRGGAEAEAVARELDNLHDAAARADEGRYFAHFAPEAVFLGTDGAERWDMPAFRAFAHPHFASGKGWTYHPLRRSIAFDASGQVAWFDEDLRGNRVGPTRGTGALVRRAGRWLLVQYSLSLTVPNERFDAVREAIDAAAAAPTSPREK